MTVYLDAAASTPVDPAVVAGMVEVMESAAANPSSAHWAGRRANQMVQVARERVARLAGQGPSSVIFTSSATEANNLALRGLLPAARPAEATRRTIISARTEHPSVLATLRELADRGGVRVRLLDVDEHGQIDLEQLQATVDHTTLLVTLNAANNETGVLLDLPAVADIAHAAGAYLHVDASQLLTWGPLPPQVDIDLVTVSGHKMHGPQGVGALVAAREARHGLTALTTGGGQEGGLRSGTTNVAGVVGLGIAADQAVTIGGEAAVRVAALRDQLHHALVDRLSPRSGSAPGTLRPDLPMLNGHARHRLPGVLNLAFGDTENPIDAEQVLAAAPSVAASTGSACSAGMPGPSPVLLAMGHTIERAEASIRFSLSRMTKPTDVEAAVGALVTAIELIAEGAPSSEPGPEPDPHRLSERPATIRRDDAGPGETPTAASRNQIDVIYMRKGARA